MPCERISDCACFGANPTCNSKSKIEEPGQLYAQTTPCNPKIHSSYLLLILWAKSDSYLIFDVPGTGGRGTEGGPVGAGFGVVGVSGMCVDHHQFTHNWNDIWIKLTSVTGLRGISVNTGQEHMIDIRFCQPILAHTPWAISNPGTVRQPVWEWGRRRTVPHCSYWVLQMVTWWFWKVARGLRHRPSGSEHGMVQCLFRFRFVLCFS